MKAKNLHNSSPVIETHQRTRSFPTSVIDYIFGFRSTYLLWEKPYACTLLDSGLCSLNPSRDQELFHRAVRTKLKLARPWRVRYFPVQRKTYHTGMLIYVSTPTSNEPGCMHLHIAYKLWKGKNLRETINLKKNQFKICECRKLWQFLAVT